MPFGWQWWKPCEDQAWDYQPATASAASLAVGGCLSLSHSFIKSRTSLQGHFTTASSHLLHLGSLHSWYTSWYMALLSWCWEAGLTSSMAVGSANRSCSGNGSLQPWQMVHSYSLQPVAMACWNISWSRYSQWRLLCVYCCCSWRYTSESNCHSASLTGMPCAFASLLAVVIFSVQFLYCRLIKPW